MLLPSTNNNSMGSATNNANNYKRSNSLLVPAMGGMKKDPNFNNSNSKIKKPAPAKFSDSSSQSSEDSTPNSRGKPGTNSTTGGMSFGSKAKQ